MARLVLTVIALLLGGGAVFPQTFFETETVEEAEITIYAVDNPAEADLLVYFVYEPEHVTRTGVWMEVGEPHLADVLLIFVDDEREADLKIWLVDTLEESRWLNQDKKGLLRIRRKP